MIELTVLYFWVLDTTSDEKYYRRLSGISQMHFIEVITKDSLKTTDLFWFSAIHFFLIASLIRTVITFPMNWVMLIEASFY
tara:strand:- start:4344 stop:4586 length:243 start_codon:yes stop_codon:yes gene_type:complete